MLCCAGDVVQVMVGTDVEMSFSTSLFPLSTWEATSFSSDMAGPEEREKEK